jgi:hypothetical protein
MTKFGITRAGEWVAGFVTDLIIVTVAITGLSSSFLGTASLPT